MRDTAAGRYPSVDELVRTATGLAEGNPDFCALRRIGSSQRGEPIRLLTVGTGGDRNVLVVAGAHANEVVGAATTAALARHAVAYRDIYASSGIVWHFLLCLDPDSARLHRTEPSPVQSFLGHHRGFYRPAAAEQPELAPSLRPPGDELPETRALFDVIDELRPMLQCSLHGIDVGGTWVQVTRDLPGLSAALAASAAGLGIPIERGAFDTFAWPETAPGVFVMPQTGEHERFGPHVELASASTWYAPHRHGGLTALIEVPMWTSPYVDDARPPEAPAEAAILSCITRLRAAGVEVGRLVDDVGAVLPDSRLFRAARGLSDLCPVLADEWTDLAADNAPDGAAEPPPPAATTSHLTLTRAHITSLQAQTWRLPLRAAAMLLHLLDDEPRTRTQPQLRYAQNRLIALVTRWCREYEAALAATWLPVARQAEHQGRMTVAAVRLAAAAERRPLPGAKLDDPALFHPPHTNGRNPS
ncbi:3-hydroxyacyl-CoA dehydrogenase [Yinghuangia sp. KLBMP8922]|uniref:3-hydroxyacyl-CoA dehydrogenase n=1 Tax=Yinghuangia soli TaxID=2908204 RepID=A0AA41Q7I5_9ACTN|nr:3-hydroxyacyl-CoA dehydrogenase [Yinghuangia soli]